MGLTLPQYDSGWGWIQGVAVDLRRGGLDVFRTLCLRKAERVQMCPASRLSSSVSEAADSRWGWRGMRSGVCSRCAVYADVFADVVVDELESPVLPRCSMFRMFSGYEVVHADDVIPFRQEAFAQVRTEKTRPPVIKSRFI